jgi:pseudouridine synthase
MNSERRKTEDGRREVRGEVREGERLQKVLSQAGVASRRLAEELIVQGRVQVNGRTVTELGTKADPDADEIKVDGRRIHVQKRKRYILLHKPRGYITTRTDPEGRPTVMDLLRGVKEYVYPVGRLDYDSEGLLLLTNDGELTPRLLHPSYEVPRTYLAEVKGEPGRAALRRLTEAGVPIGVGEIARADQVTVTDVRRGRDARSLLEVVVHEGRHHVVRRMLAAAGFPVVRLVRTQFGPLRLNRLAPGSYRRLTQREIAELYRAVGL